jgi:signal transduction histidine kinase
MTATETTAATEERNRALLDELRRRSVENAAVAAFAHIAVTERRPEELHRAALTYLAAAAYADSTELLQTTPDCTLALIARLDDESPRDLVIAGGLHAEALRRRAPVARRLTEEDFAAAPHLRHRAQFGIATGVAAGDEVFVLAAFSRHQPFAPQATYPLQAIAATHAAALVRCATEEELADGRNRLRLTLEQLPAIVSTVNSDLVFTSAQGSALRAIGFDSGGMVGRSILEIGIPEGSAPLAAFRDALRGVSSRYEYTYLGRMYENRVEPLRDRDGKIIGCLNLGVDITEYREAETALRQSREELRRLTASMNAVQETERRRIAREVHDEMGQRLTALRIDLGLLRTELRNGGGTSEAQQRVATMFELIDETIATVRRVATELRPAILDDFGFPAALENEICAFSKRTGIAATLTFEPEDLAIDSERATALYRIMQEALTNVSRHSGATRVACSIELHDHRIYAEVHDNGRGITEQESLTTLGLIGLRERALALGGQAVFTGVAGKSTRVSVWIPDESSDRR